MSALSDPENVDLRVIDVDQRLAPGPPEEDQEADEGGSQPVAEMDEREPSTVR
jgi:hypothetical protein